MQRTSVILTALILLFGMSALAQTKSKDTKPVVKTEVATFAAGCFWCTESDFQDLPGVVSAVSGYIGGKIENPTYTQVSGGGTGHAEAVEITFDPQKISYKELLKIYWENSDPTVKDRQFCDQGSQYRVAIYYHSPEQEKLALASKSAVEKLLKTTIFTEIEKAGKFYPAEDYHQDYYQKNPVRYKYYRFNCGRDQRLEKLWKKTPSGEKADTLKF